VLCAVAVNGILLPKQFYGAGFTGVAIVLHYLVPDMTVALIYLILNIPIFILGWMYVGRRFFLYSIAGMLIFSAALAWVHVPVAVEDKILAAVLAGIMMGTGTGVILKSWGSAGGLDVLSVIFLKRFSIRLGTTILVFNSFILGTGAVVIALEGALYTLVYLYVNAHMVNLVISGLSQRKAVHIISPCSNQIRGAIMERIGRGVTILKGMGAYTGQEEDILYTVITFRELSQLKRVIREIDPDAFVVVADTLEVMGYRIGNQPHW